MQEVRIFDDNRTSKCVAHTALNVGHSLRVVMPVLVRIFDHNRTTHSTLS